MITPLFQAAADVLRFGYTVPASVRAVAMRCVVLPALLGFVRICHSCQFMLLYIPTGFLGCRKEMWSFVLPSYKNG